MSSEIYYDRAFIRVGDRFIPVVNHGSSNCFDFDAHGREVPEKHWSVLNYTFHGRQLFTEEEIRQIAAVYEAANSDNRDGIRKSRNRSFGVGEFGRWMHYHCWLTSWYQQNANQPAQKQGQYSENHKEPDSSSVQMF